MRGPLRRTNRAKDFFAKFLEDMGILGEYIRPKGQGRSNLSTASAGARRQRLIERTVSRPAIMILSVSSLITVRSGERHQHGKKCS